MFILNFLEHMIYNAILCVNIDYINLKKDSCIIDKLTRGKNFDGENN